MTPRERVLRAFRKWEGLPDRVPVQFDLCAQLLEHFGRKLGLHVRYTHNLFEDVTYRISGNEIRTAMGSDVVVVGAGPPGGYQFQKDEQGRWRNEYGMLMRQGEVYTSRSWSSPWRMPSRPRTSKRTGFPTRMRPDDTQTRRAFAAARHAMRPCRYARHVPGVVRASPVVVDILAARRDRTDEQRGRAVVATCGDLAEALVWDAERRWQPLRRDAADDHRNVPSAASQRLRLCDQCRRSPSRPPIRPFIASRVVNAYLHLKQQREEQL